MFDTILETYRGMLTEVTSPAQAFEMTEATACHGEVRIFRHARANLGEVLAEAESEYAAELLVTEGDYELTYGETLAQARRLAEALRSEFGVEPGDRVGVCCRNRPEWIVSFFAAIIAGGVAVLFNSRASADELSRAQSVVQCRAIIADSSRLRRLAEAGVSASMIAIADDGEEHAQARTFSELVAPGRPEMEPVERNSDDPAAILFTSGTTGVAKGATLTHRNLCHLEYNMRLFSAVGLGLAAKSYGMDPEQLAKMRPRFSALGIFPFFHVSGLTTLFTALQSGGMLTTMRRWDPAVALDTIERRSISFLTGPALVISDLLDQPDSARRMSSIVSIGVGGQSTPGNLAERMAAALPMAQQGNGWGMTELSGSGSAASGVLFKAKPLSCGVTSPVMDIRAVSEDGSTLGPEEVGELCVRGPLVMQGYWGDQEQTERTIRDGWLYTGDIGHVDADGFVYLVDRKKDMVISAGENIYCAEVERVLSGSDLVHEVAMFGVPDERLGERAIAAVTLRPSAEANGAEEALLQLAREMLADYKVPTEISFDLGALPRNALGKVDKQALRQRYLETTKAEV